MLHNIRWRLFSWYEQETTKLNRFLSRFYPINYWIRAAEYGMKCL
jgi:hypothetical protein